MKARRSGPADYLARVISSAGLSRRLNESLWLALAVLWAAGLCLGYIGFARHAAAAGEDLSPLDLVYLTIQLIPMNSGYVTHPVGWELELARLLIPLVAASTAVQAVASLFRQQIAILGLRFARGHIIICGLSRKGFLLVESFRRLGERVVVIEHDDHNDWIEPCRSLGAVVLLGDATDPILLTKAGLKHARCLVAVVDSDGVNAEVAVRARALSTGRTGSPLTCVIHIVDPQLCTLLREHEISREAQPCMRLELFNVFERGAHILLLEHPLKNHTAPEAPHWLVVGLGQMGETLVVQAAREWRRQFPNGPHKMRFTLVDQVASARIAALKYHYPRLDKVCELTALDLNVHSPEFIKGDYLFNSSGECQVQAVFVCLDDDSLGLHAGLTLLQKLRPQRVPIVVRMAEKGGLATLLHRETDGGNYYTHLTAFPLLDRTCTPDLLLGGTHEVLAQALHEDENHRRQISDALQDLPAWEDLPEQAREEYRKQVDRIGQKLELLGCSIAPITDWDSALFRFTTEETEKLARLEYETHSGPKRHTAAWENLPESDRAAHLAWAAELPAFLARAGFEILRSQ